MKNIYLAQKCLIKAAIANIFCNADALSSKRFLGVSFIGAFFLNNKSKNKEIFVHRKVV